MMSQQAAETADSRKDEGQDKPDSKNEPDNDAPASKDNDEHDTKPEPHDTAQATPDDRLAHLEALVMQLKEDKSKSTEKEAPKAKGDDDGDYDDLTKLKRSRSRISFIRIDEYSRRKFSLEKPHDAIDAVITSDWDSELTKSDAESLKRRQRSEPIRFIQINSPALFAILQQVQASGASPFKSARVILAPFKELAYHEKELEKALERLASVYVNADSTAADDNDASLETKDPDSVPNLTEEETRPNSLKAFTDLKILMEFYNHWIKPRWHWLRSNDVKDVAFRDLSMLFQPGDLLYVPQDIQKVYRIIKVTDGRPKILHLFSDDYTGETQSQEVMTKWVDLQLDCYFLDFDGRDIGPVQFCWSAKPWSGRKDVTKLKAYPLRLSPESEMLQSGFQANGHRFLNACQRKIRYYEGRSHADRPVKVMSRNSRPGYWYRPELRTEEPPNPEDVASQVVVDFERCFQTHIKWKPDFSFENFATHEEQVDDASYVPSIFSKKILGYTFRCYSIDQADDTRTEELRSIDEWLQSPAKKSIKDFTEDPRDDLVLLPERVVGYVLRTRLWVFLDLQQEYWRDIEPNEQAWTELQLPKEHDRTGHKRVLEALVERHFNTKELFARPSDVGLTFDFIEGKGRGLIILLHGPPGVGKTSTAEAIAEKYGKPLLPITCGGLGLDAETVETQLTRTFQLAQAWDCIVLLDEADVFLAGREKTDLKRNALVSVFLRALEYYTGIIFLTTNRIGTVDEALRSRIHVALYYPYLDLYQTELIWKTNLDRWRRHKSKTGQPLQLENEQDIMWFPSALWKYYFSRRRPPWNGRQIRNSFQTAVALAEFDAKKKNEDNPESNALPTLSMDYFKLVAAASEDFDKYLRETRKFYEEELADEKDIRANFWPGTTDRIRRSQRPMYDENSVETILRMRPGEYPRYGEPDRGPAPFPESTGLPKQPPLNDWRYDRGYPPRQDNPMAGYGPGGPAYQPQAMDGYDRYDPKPQYERQHPAAHRYPPASPRLFYESHDVTYLREQPTAPGAMSGDARDIPSAARLFGPERESPRHLHSSSTHSQQAGERPIGPQDSGSPYQGRQ